MRRPVDSSHYKKFFDIMERKGLYGKLTPISSHEDGRVPNLKLEINVRDAETAERFIVALEKV